MNSSYWEREYLPFQCRRFVLWQKGAESRRDRVMWRCCRPAGKRICSDVASVLWCKLRRDRKRPFIYFYMIKALRLRHGMLQPRNQGPMKAGEDCLPFSAAIAFLTEVLIRE